MKARRIAVSVLALVVAWQALSTWDPSMFPPPAAVLGTALEFSLEGDIRGHSALYHLALTFGRVAVATTVAITLGVVLAIAMWGNDAVEGVVTFWLPIWMTPPDVIVILITMILLGFNSLAVVVSVAFVYTPFGLVTIWEGMQDIDGDLLEMGTAFEAGRRQIWRHVYLPHLLSYVFSALRTIFGMTWKVAVIAEVFGIDRGVGAQIRFWFTQGEITMVLAYTVMFVGVVLVVEYGALQPIQRRAFVWREEGPA